MPPSKPHFKVLLCIMLQWIKISNDTAKRKEIFVTQVFILLKNITKNTESKYIPVGVI